MAWPGGSGGDRHAKLRIQSWNWRRLNERRRAAAIRRNGNDRNGRHDLGGCEYMLAMVGGNECPHRGSGAARGKRGAEAAQLFGAVMCVDIVERRVKVGRCRQHPHANHHRQHDAQASLQAMRMRCEERQCHGQGLLQPSRTAQYHNVCIVLAPGRGECRWVQAPSSGRVTGLP